MKIYRVLDQQKKIRLVNSGNGRDFNALSGDLFSGGLQVTGERVEVSSILAPFEPKVIFCIGLNYRKHAEETKSPIPQIPVLFLKSPMAVIPAGEPILLPRQLRSDKVDYEAELGVVIGKRCKNVKKEDALKYVFGYTAANDVSARDWQKEWGGSQWCRAKTFDTFCPLGPAVITADEIPNPNQLAISSRVNGEVRQKSNTSDMIFDVASVIEFLSGSTTLDAGTLILTGTPEGVGMAFDPPKYLKDGDKVEIEIEKIGVLANPVLDEKS